MTLVFGASTAELNRQVTGQDSSSFTRNINSLILYFVYLFVARFVIGYVGTLLVCIAAARTAASLRKDFLDKLLRQDVAHFDKDHSGSAATQVTTSKVPFIRPLVSMLTSITRWQQDQSRHSRETVHMYSRHLTVLLWLHRRAGCTMETRLNRNEHHTRDHSHHRRMHRPRCSYRG